MTHQEQSIRAWHATMLLLEQHMAALTELTGASPDSPLIRAIWDAANGYTEAVDAACGGNGHLPYWWLECELGRKHGRIGLGNEPMRDIHTLDDLVGLVRDDMARGREAA